MVEQALRSRADSASGTIRGSIASFGERLAQALQRGSGPLLLGAQRWSYADVLEAVPRIAGALARAGISTGDRVAIVSENSPEAALLILASAWCGATFTVLHPRLARNSLLRVLAAVEPRVIASDRSVQLPLSSASEALCVALQDETSPALPFARLVEGPPMAQCRAHAGALLALIFTSGSSGIPRGVMVRPENLIFSSIAIQARLGYRPSDVVGLFTPLSFDYGLYQLFLAIEAGAAVWLGRGLDTGPSWARELSSSGSTVLPLMPSLIASLLMLMRRPGFEMPTLRCITSTGEHLPHASVEALRSRLPQVSLHSMYGLTECKRVSILQPEQWSTKAHTVGRPLDGTEVHAVDTHGQPVPRGIVGQLRVIGDHVTAGYWRAPHATAKRFVVMPDGRHALLTRDFGRIDGDGFIEVLARMDGLLKHQGFRIGGPEIEREACRLPGVFEAGLVRHPDHDSLHLFVRSHGEPDAAELLDRLRDRLEWYKIPSTVHFVSELPRTPNGKLDRAALTTRLKGA